MENKAHYFLIGLFVFGIFFASLFLIIWLSDFSNKQEFKFYQIYTKESISGLGIKAPVRLLGVDVGSVEESSIANLKEGIGVRVLVKLKADTPISENTYATLQLQGITGLKYIELKNDEFFDDSQDLKPEKTEKIPTIKTKESFLANIDKQSDKIFDLIDFTSSRMKILLSDENIQNFSSLLKHSATAMNNLSLASKKVSLISDAVNMAAKDFSSLSEETFALMSGFSELQTNFNSSLVKLQDLFVQMQLLAKDLEQSPSDLIFKSIQYKKAPGE